jgi:hypothetical protein
MTLFAKLCFGDPKLALESFRHLGSQPTRLFRLLKPT